MSTKIVSIVFDSEHISADVTFKDDDEGAYTFEEEDYQVLVDHISTSPLLPKINISYA